LGSEETKQDAKPGEGRCWRGGQSASKQEEPGEGKKIGRGKDRAWYWSVRYV